MLFCINEEPCFCRDHVMLVWRRGGGLRPGLGPRWATRRRGTKVLVVMLRGGLGYTRGLGLFDSFKLSSKLLGIYTLVGFNLTVCKINYKHKLAPSLFLPIFLFPLVTSHLPLFTSYIYFYFIFKPSHAFMYIFISYKLRRQWRLSFYFILPCSHVHNTIAHIFIPSSQFLFSFFYLSISEFLHLIFSFLRHFSKSEFNIA